MKVNKVKCWFLRRGETGVPGENLEFACVNANLSDLGAAAICVTAYAGF